MFKKVLIANRGEIACRIIKTLKRLNIQSVAVYAEPEAEALHVTLADEAYCIGPVALDQSYLNQNALIEIAKRTQAEAIHPGYGFLSENASFAERCAQENICFIGPLPQAIRDMGSKSLAKTLMAKAGVPMLPGYHGDKQDLKSLQKAADDIGYPVLLKAVSGGGGKGMRLVENTQDFEAALAATQREAAKSFGDDTVLIEKYLTAPRHVEMQVFSDTQGNCVYLFERDCSIQRRHQKVLEEAPAPNLPEKIRAAMGDIAVAACKAIGYVGAGTLEFLLDHDQQFYFMEMNTRLQVEHPVTERITGLDLVEWQCRIAAGEQLPVSQGDLTVKGHAIEARLYAESPLNDFLPATGEITYLQTPDCDKHVRIDTGVRQNDNITPYYDPMIAKLIVWDIDREAAVQRLQEALADYHVLGFSTNTALLRNIAKHPAFMKADLSTHFIDEHRATLLTPPPAVGDKELALACLYRLCTQKTLDNIENPWQTHDAWQMLLPATQTLSFELDHQPLHIRITQANDQYLCSLPSGAQLNLSGNLDKQTLQACIDGESFTTLVLEQGSNLVLINEGHSFELALYSPAAHYAETETAAGLLAPMPGVVSSVFVTNGDTVEQGQALMILEAMKMEHTIHAPQSGTISTLFYQPGDQVDEGATLLSMEE